MSVAAASWSNKVMRQLFVSNLRGFDDELAVISASTEQHRHHGRHYQRKRPNALALASMPTRNQKMVADLLR